MPCRAGYGPAGPKEGDFGGDLLWQAFGDRFGRACRVEYGVATAGKSVAGALCGATEA